MLIVTELDGKEIEAWTWLRKWREKWNKKWIEKGYPEYVHKTAAELTDTELAYELVKIRKEVKELGEGKADD